MDLEDLPRAQDQSRIVASDEPGQSKEREPMTPEDVKQNVSAWCSSVDGLEMLGERSEPGADFAIAVRSQLGKDAAVEALVLQEPGQDRVTVRHTASLSSGSEAGAQSVLDARPGSVTGSVDRGWSGTSVAVQTHVYHDGLNKNSFVQALAEIARTAQLLGAITATAAASTASTAATASTASTDAAASTQQPVHASTTPQATAAAQPQSMPAPSFSPQPQPQPQPQQQPAPQPVPAQASWVPTHSVPPQGLRAWAAPDPAGPVVATLAPGLPIQVSEVRGAWARVICSNGWTGWIDGRIIGVAA